MSSSRRKKRKLLKRGQKEVIIWADDAANRNNPDSSFNDGKAERERKLLEVQTKWYEMLLQNEQKPMQRRFSVGRWLSQDASVLVEQAHGSALQQMGRRVRGGGIKLNVEEAVWLFDKRCLRILDDRSGAELSSQQCFDLLGRSGTSLSSYLCYAHFRRSGFAVLRHDPVRLASAAEATTTRSSPVSSRKPPKTKRTNKHMPSSSVWQRCWWPSVQVMKEDSPKWGVFQEIHRNQVLKETQVIQPLELHALTTADGTSQPNVLERNLRLCITFDVFAPGILRKISQPPTPSFCVVVAHFEDVMPSFDELAALVQKVHPVPLRFCIDQGTSLSFLDFHGERIDDFE